MKLNDKAKHVEQYFYMRMGNRLLWRAIHIHPPFISLVGGATTHDCLKVWNFIEAQHVTSFLFLHRSRIRLLIVLLPLYYSCECIKQQAFICKLGSTQPQDESVDYYHKVEWRRCTNSVFFVVTIFLPHGLTDLRELLHAQMVMRCTSARCGGGASTDDVSILRMHCIITTFFLHYQKDAAQSCCPVRSNIQLISSFKCFHDPMG